MKINTKRIISLILCFSMLFSNFAAFGDTPSITPEDGSELEWRTVDGSTIGKESGREYRVQFVKPPKYTYTTSTRPSSGDITVIDAVYRTTYPMVEEPQYSYRWVREIDEAAHDEERSVTVEVDEKVFSHNKTVVDKKAWTEHIYETRQSRTLERAGHWKTEYYTVPGYWKTEYRMNEDGGVDRVRVFVDPVRRSRRVWIRAVYSLSVERVLVDSIYHPAETHQEPVYKFVTRTKTITKTVRVPATYKRVRERYVSDYEWVEDRSRPQRVLVTPEKYRVTVTPGWEAIPATAKPLKTDQELLDESVNRSFRNASTSSQLNSVLRDAISRGASSSLISEIRSEYERVKQEELDDRFESDLNNVTTAIDAYRLYERAGNSDVSNDVVSRIYAKYRALKAAEDKARIDTLINEASSLSPSAIISRLDNFESLYGSISGNGRLETVYENIISNDKERILRIARNNKNNLSVLESKKSEASTNGYTSVVNQIISLIDEYHLNDQKARYQSHINNRTYLEGLLEEVTDSSLADRITIRIAYLKVEEIKDEINATSTLEELKVLYGKCVSNPELLLVYNTRYVELLENKIDGRVWTIEELIALYRVHGSFRSAVENKIIEKIQSDKNRISNLNAFTQHSELLAYYNEYTLADEVDVPASIMRRVNEEIKEAIHNAGPYYYKFEDGLAVIREYPQSYSNATVVNEAGYIEYINGQNFEHNVEHDNVISNPSDAFVFGKGGEETARYHKLIYVANNGELTKYDVNTLKYKTIYGNLVTDSDYNSYGPERFDIYDFMKGFIFGALEGVFDDAKELITMVTKAVTEFESVVSKIWTGVKNAFKFVIEFPKKLSSIEIDGDILDALLTSVGALINFIGDAITGVEDDELGKGLGFVVGTIIADKITGPIGGVVDMVGAATGNSTITKVLKGLFSLMDGSAVDILRDKISDVVGKIVSIFEFEPKKPIPLFKVISEQGCFVAGTKVLTIDGYKNIEDINVGDIVYSKNLLNNRIEEKIVYSTFTGVKEDIYEILVDGELIEATKEHPFYVVGKEWVEAKDLTTSDILINKHGKKLNIESITIRETSGTDIYNLSVADNHNYFVSKENVLTHNIDCSKFRIELKKSGKLTDESKERLLEIARKGEISDVEFDEISELLTRNNDTDFLDDLRRVKGTSNLAEKFRTIGDDILDAGHTVEKHVAQTNQDLIKRAFQEGVDASSFTNQRTAIDAVKEALRKNTDDIAAWLANPESGKKAFTTLHNNPIGKGVQAGKNTVIDGITQSTIVLVKDTTQEFGFKVLTAFPKVQ